MSSMDFEPDGGVKLTFSRKSSVSMSSYAPSDRPEANRAALSCAPTADQVSEETDDWTYEMVFVGYHFAGFTYGFMTQALKLTSDRPEMILRQDPCESSFRTARRSKYQSMWRDSTEPLRQRRYEDLRRWRYEELIGDIFAGYFKESPTARLERKSREIKDHGGYFFEMHDESVIDGHIPVCNKCRMRKFRPAEEDIKKKYKCMMDKIEEIFDGLRFPNDLQSFDGKVDDGGSGRLGLPAKPKHAFHAPFDKWPGLDLPPPAASAERQSRRKTYDDEGWGRMQVSGSDKFERDDCRHDPAENMSDYERRIVELETGVPFPAQR
ncbi:MAG: hypothetical protein Q9173_001680 [Seirophora scorigena]